jgi:centromere/kinetochore protein ZW10
LFQDIIRTSTGHTDRTIKSLLLDLEQIIVFLNGHLPSEFSRPLSEVLMPKLCSQIKETWLDSAVPTSLQDMTAFRKAIAMVQIFADNLKALQWTGAEELHVWVASAPRIWLTKRRETSLDWTRNQLSLGELLHGCFI